MHRFSFVASLALSCCGWGLTQSAMAQTQMQPQNVLQLSASSSVEVQQDLLSLTLASTRQGSDAAALQQQLKVAVDAALAIAKPKEAAGKLDVRTNQFNLYPRYSRDGKITGWEGRAELVLSGREFPLITRVASEITSMTISDVSFALSREAQAKAQERVQFDAIRAFRVKAGEIASAFGFADYGIREVSVQSNDMPAPMAVMNKMRKTEAQQMASDGAPLALEPGKSEVSITVSGTVQGR